MTRPKPAYIQVTGIQRRQGCRRVDTEPRNAYSSLRVSKEHKDGARLPVLQGTLQLLVLRVLMDGPKHGQAISRRLSDLSREWLQVDEGSLYPCLYRMENRGWIDSEERLSENNRRARYYRLTAEGKRQLQIERENWKNFNRVVNGILKGA